MNDVSRKWPGRREFVNGRFATAIERLNPDMLVNAALTGHTDSRRAGGLLRLAQRELRLGLLANSEAGSFPARSEIAQPLSISEGSLTI